MRKIEETREGFLLESPLQSDIHNPTLQQVAELAQRLIAADEETVSDFSDFLILTKLGEQYVGVDCCYMQARPERGHGYYGVFIVEFYDGNAKRHYQSFVTAGPPLLAVFDSYLKEDNAWRTMENWRDISALFKRLRPYLPPEESAASFFPDGEWDAGLEAKRQRDEEFWKEFE